MTDKNETEETKPENVVVPVEFLRDFSNLSNHSIRMYLIFLEMAGGIINKPEWVHCGYDHLMAETGIRNKTYIRKGMLELVAAGWIVGFRRGYLAGAKRVANQYCISPNKNLEAAMELMVKMQDFNSGRNRSTAAS